MVKIAGSNVREFVGTARVFDVEEDALDYVLDQRLRPGDVVVIRYEGPRGGPGMREMLAVTGRHQGHGSRRRRALVTDGRFSGATEGFCIGHVAPEALHRRADRAHRRTATR